MQLTTIEKQTKELEVVKPVEVPFNGSYIEAVEYCGVVYVGVRKTCEDLGLSFSGQSEKINKDKVLSSGVQFIRTPDKRGRIQDQLYISKKMYTFWLTKIQSSRVNKDLQPLLEKYQMESADVLDSHFSNKQQAPNSVIDYLEMDEDERAIAYFTQKKEKKLLLEQYKILEEENKKLSDKASGFDRFINSEGLIATADFAKALESGWGVGLFHELLRVRDIFKKSSNSPRQIYAKYIVRKWVINERGRKVPVLYIKNEGIKFFQKMVDSFESDIKGQKITKKLIQVTYNRTA